MGGSCRAPLSVAAGSTAWLLPRGWLILHEQFFQGQYRRLSLVLPATHRAMNAPGARCAFLCARSTKISVSIGESCRRAFGLPRVCCIFSCSRSPLKFTEIFCIVKRRVRSSFDNQWRRVRPPRPSSEIAGAKQSQGYKQWGNKTRFAQTASAIIAKSPASPQMPSQAQQLCATFRAEVWFVHSEDSSAITNDCPNLRRRSGFLADVLSTSVVLLGPASNSNHN